MLAFLSNKFSGLRPCEISKNTFFTVHLRTTATNKKAISNYVQKQNFFTFSKLFFLLIISVNIFAFSITTFVTTDCYTLVIILENE